MNEKGKTDKAADETRPIPSQAEGGDPATGGGGDRPVPSQAEGDEATVDQSLRQKERKQ